MRSQVTTGRGDAGETTALSGADLPKDHILLECVGCVDELRAHLALARMHVLSVRQHDYLEAGEGERVDPAGVLFWMMHMCFAIGARCSDPLVRKPEFHRVSVGAAHIRRLERVQAAIEAVIRLPRSFVVSAASVAGAEIDVACTVARRLERNVARLADATPGFSAPDLVAYLNRQSDLLFMLARYVDAGQTINLDYSVLSEES